MKSKVTTIGVIGVVLLTIGCLSINFRRPETPEELQFSVDFTATVAHGVGCNDRRFLKWACQKDRIGVGLVVLNHLYIAAKSLFAKGSANDFSRQPFVQEIKRRQNISGAGLIDHVEVVQGRKLPGLLLNFHVPGLEKAKQK